MRAHEFIKDPVVNEAVPAVLGAIGGALARGAAAGAQALGRGIAAAGSTAVKAGTQAVKTLGSTATGLAKQAGSAAATSLGTNLGANIANKLSGQQQANNPPLPAQIAPGVKVEPVVSKDPNKLSFKIGDAVFTLDPKDPANAQTMRQLNQLTPK